MQFQMIELDKDLNLSNVSEFIRLNSGVYETMIAEPKFGRIIDFIYDHPTELLDPSGAIVPALHTIKWHTEQLEDLRRKNHSMAIELRDLKTKKLKMNRKQTVLIIGGIGAIFATGIGVGLLIQKFKDRNKEEEKNEVDQK